MIKLKTLDLEALNLRNMEHFRFVNRMSQDEKTKYISSRLNDFVEEPTDKENFEVGKTYIIRDGKKNIGLLGTKELDRRGDLEPWILIYPDERGKKYGEKITFELIPLFLDNVENLKDIKLVINKSNYASKKIVENAGYIKQPEEATYDSETYRYFGK